MDAPVNTVAETETKSSIFGTGKPRDEKVKCIYTLYSGYINYEIDIIERENISRSYVNVKLYFISSIKHV